MRPTPRLTHAEGGPCAPRAVTGASVESPRAERPAHLCAVAPTPGVLKFGVFKRALCGLLLLGGLPACSSPGEKGPPRAAMSVTGMGWLRDRELKLSLERLLGDERGERLPANAVEDAMFLQIGRAHV